MSELDTRTSVPADACGIVAYRNNQYSTGGIPDQLQAQTPDEVAVIIRLTEGEELVGYYGSMTGIGAYVHTLTAEWLDLRTNQVLATHTFAGGDPPYSTDGRSGLREYGSMVDLAEVSAWVDAEWAALQGV